mmetsp:Transcript_32826/g.69048  ORF Transcript_32826/g.69048 Transcript_32826/m.69048 type:complete len:138 (-) Transcript_32826:951-1364(-)|eukprot:CAMPEP_0172298490 /NCGR_PEP_ID=MMETSP1058-20130122/1121_1 /TAXON_ID=83371 /ORGANISM="Detonula confervacea, Strain CCMP 353" /LENGTH=137 /DNA_ID=CAMNT_0013007765 /DNA_START=114 /DNA_END=527 /DNA_ORIENTATION=-
MKIVYAMLGLTVLTGSAVAFSRRSAPSIIRRSSTTAAFASPAEFAKSEIASNDVVVFSKSYCPFCTTTKQLFSSMDIDAKVIELDNMDNGAEIQAALLDISGQRTVPNVFVKGEHLGGNDDTQGAARSGKLAELLKK